MTDNHRDMVGEGIIPIGYDFNKAKREIEIKKLGGDPSLAGIQAAQFAHGMHDGMSMQDKMKRSRIVISNVFQAMQRLARGASHQNLREYELTALSGSIVNRVNEIVSPSIISACGEAMLSAISSCNLEIGHEYEMTCLRDKLEEHSSGMFAFNTNTGEICINPMAISKMISSLVGNILHQQTNKTQIINEEKEFNP